MKLSEVRNIIFPEAFALLSPGANSTEAQIELLSIGLQESKFLYRKQLGNGPARGFWQFEEGNATSRGGVWGVVNHPKTAAKLKQVCRARGVAFDVKTIWRTLETDDVLSCCVARLLSTIDSRPLPKATERSKAWDTYIFGWRPGKPKPESWSDNHGAAVMEVLG